MRKQAALNIITHEIYYFYYYSNPERRPEPRWVKTTSFNSKSKNTKQNETKVRDIERNRREYLNKKHEDTKKIKQKNGIIDKKRLGIYMYV